MFIAIAPKGKEFVYKSITRISVPKASAQRIADALNQEKYKLKDGEVWHAYDTEISEDEMYGKAWIRNGHLKVRWEVVYP